MRCTPPGGSAPVGCSLGKGSRTARGEGTRRARISVRLQVPSPRSIEATLSPQVRLSRARPCRVSPVPSRPRSCCSSSAVLGKGVCGATRCSISSALADDMGRSSLMVTSRSHVYASFVPGPARRNDLVVVGLAWIPTSVGDVFDHEGGGHGPDRGQFCQGTRGRREAITTLVQWQLFSGSATSGVGRTDRVGPDHGWKVFLDEAAASQLWKAGG